MKRGLQAVALGAIIISFSGTYVRLADVAPATNAFWRCFWAAPFLWFLARREDKRLGPRTSRQRKIGFLAGIAFGIDLIFWNWSIREIGAGIATVLGNLSAFVMTVMAWIFLREKPSKATLLMLPVVLFGVVLTAGVITGRAYGNNPLLGVLFGGLCSVAYGSYLLLLRQGHMEGERLAGPLSDSTIVAALSALVMGPFAGGIDLTPPASSQFWMITLAWTCGIVGWLVITYGLGRLPAALGGMTLLIQPAAGVLISAAIVDERPSIEQILGCIVIVFGILGAVIGNRRVEVAAPRE